MPEFTHIDKEGRVRMVDVTDKEHSQRVAVAQGVVSMNPETFEKIRDQSVKKGNVLETARIAGIMAAKKTSELIPMCHPLLISHVSVDFCPDKAINSIRIEALARVTGQTGVEMEALTAVSVAALTIYDMCKSYDRKMTISDILLLEKSGGKSGKFVRPTP
ncbi:cyclic pyranopterin monophosphate synthase [Desulfosarcina sp. BuS5]|uniref:cyclic pyranopterin monophosphate synthase MoaC n=1 Tax=Desulfosarcina sp. BuS5 TaxID=933262 RepID=UPI000481A9AA|nr:cyclic pyranopterin monophosphate synthase MoaC [Desulfosarcina sp. BuS5]WDN90519.1 cyclic pyranopterin monophosphate synthase [Desulfosarcina sp. BuS5]